MGPPSLHFPPRPMEPRSMDIDLSPRNLISVSRTLPSPSVALPSTWEPPFQAQALGDIPYGSSNASRMGLTDSHSRGSPQGPLLNWWQANDGPWIPQSVIPDVGSNDRLSTKHVGIHKHQSFGNQYRQPNPSDAGSFHYHTPSDSGYATLRSVGNTSVFSADVPERDQDCQSLASHVADYQPFGINDIQQRDSRTADSWSSTGQESLDPNPHYCHTCKTPVKTPSELK